MKKRCKKLNMFIVYFIAFIIITWTIATYYVEQEGPRYHKIFSVENSDKRALIIYDPDPLFNLDERLCNAIAEGLESSHWNAIVTSVSNSSEIDLEEYDLYVFCANTYNWAPDRAIRNLISKKDFFVGEKVAALTVGSGSTSRASRLLKKLIEDNKGKLISSEEMWLLRPNREDIQDISNSQVAVEEAKRWGHHLSDLVAKNE